MNSCLSKAMKAAIIGASLVASSASAGTIVAPGANEYRRWKDNIMPYEFEASVPDTTRLIFEQAMMHIHKNSAFRFIHRNSSNQSQYPVYAYLTSRTGEDEGCEASQHGAPSVGYVRVNLNADSGGCQQVSTAVHELMHAIGFMHEQKRPDRDQYVYYYKENVCVDIEPEDNCFPGYGQWEIVPSALTTTDYDYRSLLHYGSGQFAKSGTVVLESIDPNKVIDPSSRLSTIDKQALDQFYPPYKAVARLEEGVKRVFMGNDVSFDASQSFDPEGYELTYLWHFSESASPYNGGDHETYTFPDPGNYRVKLIVTDSGGSHDYDVQDVEVLGAEVLLASYSTLL